MKATKFVLFIFYSLITLSGYSQTYDLNLKVRTTEKVKSYKESLKSNKIKKNNEINFLHLEQGTIESSMSFFNGYYLKDAEENKYPITKNMYDGFELLNPDIQQFWDWQIISKVMYNLGKEGTQLDLRNEAEEEALECINRIQSNNGELKDPYLENYIYGLFAKIAPKRFLDGRPSNINILIQQHPSVNALTYPNGTIILTTGLLSVLHSEDELVAILAHEIAHFVLDHAIINVNKGVQRAKRAEFWSAVLTGVTAAVEVAAASKNSHYIPGAATASVAMFSTLASKQILNRLGMEFNHEQEEEADAIAVKILQLLGYNENALSGALSRIAKHYFAERDMTPYVSTYTHPDLISRINNMGKYGDYPIDRSFEQTVSFAVTNTAIMKYYNRRFSQCLSLVTQNIVNNVGTSDDYILKAKCLLALENTPDSNTEVLNLIQKAKKLNTGTFINYYSTEIVAYLRLHDKTNAMNGLNQYIQQLNLIQDDLIKTRSSRYWDNMHSFIETETNWAKRMIVKLNGTL